MKLTYRQKRIWAITRLLKRLQAKVKGVDSVLFDEIMYWAEELERLEMSL